MPLGFKHYFFAVFILFHGASFSVEKQDVHALYIPLADHYAAIVAYEKFRHELQYANFTLEKMPNWDLLKAKFSAGDADMAFSMSPLALAMYAKNPNFKWIGLMHRDGNGLAVNHKLSAQLALHHSRVNRAPNNGLANVVRAEIKKGQRVIIGVPHLKSTHSVALYAYFKLHNLHVSFQPNINDDVLAVAVAPAKSPGFVLSYNNRGMPAAIEQSLPWIDVVETGNFGKVIWYSKDVLETQHGHVECIALANLSALETKHAAIKETFNLIKKAGALIEQARNQGGPSLDEVIQIVQKHIPLHTEKAIRASLDPNLRVINYERLDIDKPGLTTIMNLALEGGVINQAVDIDEFAADTFLIEQKGNQ
jgi:NitT/TauT family transport system substrate-binding protein